MRKYFKLRALRTVGVSLLIGCSVVWAGHIAISRLPIAYAANNNACIGGSDANFLSASTSSCSSSDRWDVLNLTSTAGAPGGSVNPGQTFRVSVSYTINQPITNGDTADLFLGFNIDQNVCSAAPGWGGCLFNPIQGKSLAPHIDDNPSDGNGGYSNNHDDNNHNGNLDNVEVSNNCPSFYYAEQPIATRTANNSSHFADPTYDTPGGTAGTWANVDAGDNPPSNDPADDGLSGCGDSGKAVIWPNVITGGAGTTRSYSVSFHVNPSNSAAGHSFCMYAHLSLNTLPNVYARQQNADQGSYCWTIVKPPPPSCSGSCGSVGIAGTVTDAITGDGIGGLPVSYGADEASCALPSSTNTYLFAAPGGGTSAGYYFTEPSGYHFCLGVPGSFDDTANSGYVYENPNPTSQVASDPGGKTGYQQQVAGIDCSDAYSHSTDGQNCVNLNSAFLSSQGQDNSHITTNPSSGFPGSHGLCDQGTSTAGDGGGATGVFQDWDGNHNQTCTQDVFKTVDPAGTSGSCQSIDSGYTDNKPGYPNGTPADSDQTCNTSGSGSNKTHAVYDWDEYVSTFATYPYSLQNFVSCGTGCTTDIKYNWQYTPYVTISGTVSNATLGKGFAGITIDDCAGSTTVTDANGNYSFQLPLNTPFCIRESAQYSYEPGVPTTDGTDAGIALDGPQLNQAYTLTGTSYEGQVASGNQGDYDFTYTNPILSLTKSVSSPAASWANGTPTGCTAGATGSGSCVKPGQTLTYTVTGTNSGSDTSNYALEDFIPENIDPTTATIASVTYNGNALSCPSNTVNSSTNFGGYTCGILGNTGQTAYDSGGPSDTPPEVFVQLGTFSGSGGSLVVTWSGKVYDSTNVGVFPSNYSFCANAADYSNRNNCDDFANGLQAATNFARSSYHYPGYTVANYGATPGPWSGWGIDSAGNADGRGGTKSAIVINPIPATISCATKSSSMSIDPSPPVGANPLSSTMCDGRSASDYYLYVPGDGDHDTGTMSLEVSRDTTEGPLYYGLYDQNPSTGVYGDMDVSPNSELPNAKYTGAAGGPGALLSWGNSNSPSGQEHLAGSTLYDGYSFTANFVSGTPVVNPGSSFPNSTEVCPVEYWIAGHGTGPNTSNCKQSNVIHFTRYNNNSPYVTTTNGDVHAGSTVTPVTGGFCGIGAGAVNPGVNTVFNNGTTNPIGQYLVTAGNNVSGPWNGVIANVGTVGAANGVGVVMRPNLCDAAAKASVKQGGVISGNDPTHGVLPWPSDTSFNDNAKSVTNPSGIAGPGGATTNVDGNVVTVNGNYTLGSATVGASSGNNATPPQVTINNRWTLYVTGNLYINANIGYGTPVRTPSAGTPSDAEVNHPSFGVIVEGNIYIAKNVTSLAGFYVASQVINTCASYDGKSLTYETSGSPATLTSPAIPSISYTGAYSVQDCSRQLNVDGILYADTLRLNRTYGYNGASGPAEQINDDDRLYTATPPAFNALVTASQLSQYLVEPLPRY